MAHFGREGRAPRAPSEYKEKVIQVKRVTKVVKGGKRMRFRALIIIGNEKGQVGSGVAKAREVPVAVQKAIAKAKKSLITVPLVGYTIPHWVVGREGSSRVILKPAPAGTGVIAGGAARIVLELAGIRDIVAKTVGSSNAVNSARAALNGLRSLKRLEEVQNVRGRQLKVSWRQPTGLPAAPAKNEKVG